MRYDVFVTVWGQDFVEKFVEFSLGSQLAAGNIPALAEQADIHYHIYTDRESRDFFEPALDALSKFAEPHFYFYDEIPYGGGRLDQAIANSEPSTIKHNVQRITAQHMLSRLEDATAILLDSDFIIADGSLARLHELRLQGKRAVSTMLMRLDQDSAAPILRQNLSAHLSPRALVRLCLDHMHPIFAGYFVDAAQPTSYPSQLNWRVGQKDNVSGVVTHCLFPHPLMVMPDPLGGESASKYFSTMDYDYALRAVADDDAIYLSPSSDEILICKLSPAAYLADNEIGDSPSIDRMAHFILNNSNIRHRLFMDQAIHFIADDEGDWEGLSGEADRFIEAAYKALELMVAQLSTGDATTLLHLKSFLGPIEDFLSPQVQSRMQGWLSD
tara:strand:+ start:1992 stop:3146 length:1155 start_codon:yes stop_codon:yes gene_type:complete